MSRFVTKKTGKSPRFSGEKVAGVLAHALLDCIDDEEGLDSRRPSSRRR
jgi:hypothetical protein